MAQGKRTDIKTKAKVIKAKLENIDKPNTQIAKDLWIDDTTVGDIIRKDLPKLPEIDVEMGKLLRWDLEIMLTIQTQKKERLATKEVRDGDMDSWENTAFKRSQLIQWKNTEQVGLEDVTPERKNFLLWLLGKK